MALLSGSGGTSNCAGYKGSEVLESQGTITAIYSSPYVHSGANCTVNYIEVNVDDSSATKLVIGIYANNGGVPGAKLAQTAEVNAPDGYTWVGDSLSSSVTFIDGVTYHFAFQGNAAIAYNRVTAGTGRYDVTAYSSTMPATFTDAGSTGRTIAARASYQ